MLVIPPSSLYSVNEPPSPRGACEVDDDKVAEGVTVDDGIISGEEEEDVPFLTASELSIGGDGLTDADSETVVFSG